MCRAGLFSLTFSLLQMMPWMWWLSPSPRLPQSPLLPSLYALSLLPLPPRQRWTVMPRFPLLLPSTLLSPLSPPLKLVSAFSLCVHVVPLYIAADFTSDTACLMHKHLFWKVNLHFCSAAGKEESADNSEVEPSVPTRPVPSPTAFTHPAHTNMQRVSCF